MTKFFLYFDSADDASSVALELDLKLNTRSVVKEVKAKPWPAAMELDPRGEYNIGHSTRPHSWVVITTAETPGTSPGVRPEDYRALMESIAKQNRGEYEGWIKQ
jgi:hypothetical protein